MDRLEEMPESSSTNQIDEANIFSDFFEDLDSDFEEESTFFFSENSFEKEEEEEKDNLPNQNPIRSSESNTFATDFYGSGSDWSCLRVNSPSDSKKLKQTDLFQMWGLKRHKKEDEKKNKKNNNNVTQLHLLPPIKSNLNPNPNQRSSSSSMVPLNKPFDSEVSLKRKPLTRQPRPCSFYKKIPGTPFTVDAFRYGAIKGCLSYFLSHFHADHYGGLSKAWSYGPIYCTPITARLVRMRLSVNPSFICPLEMDVEHVIDGYKVTLLEANHCPGAAMIHFQLPNGQCHLHTGDFRASKYMQSYPLLVNKRVDVLYLDTTYCNPKYRFPSKEEVMNFVVRTTRTCLKKQPRTLVIVGAYSIGKECVYMAISEALKVKIYADSSRRRILQSLEWPHLSENICSNGKDTPLHVLPISLLRHETLKNYLKTYKDQFTAVVAFRPTGWTFSESVGSHLDLIKPNSKGNIQIYGVPYSEHSSFTELQEFVEFLKPKKIIPTVNISSAANREKQQSYFRQWLNG